MVNRTAFPGIAIATTSIRGNTAVLTTAAYTVTLAVGTGANGSTIIGATVPAASDASYHAVLRNLVLKKTCPPSNRKRYTLANPSWRFPSERGPTSYRPAAFFRNEPRSHPGTLPFTTRGTSVRCSDNDELQNADHPGGPGGGGEGVPTACALSPAAAASANTANAAATQTVTAGTRVVIVRSEPTADSGGEYGGETGNPWGTPREEGAKL